MRLPRTARILAKTQFDAVFARGARMGGAFFRIHVLAEPGTAARLGVALAKRSIPLAVARNRLRRQIREAFRLQRDDLAGRAIVFLARNEARDAPNAAIRADIESLLRRAAALNPTPASGTMPS